MQLNAVSISKSPNEYYQKIISKSGLKMDLYPALCVLTVLIMVYFMFPDSEAVWSVNNQQFGFS